MEHKLPPIDVDRLLEEPELEEILKNEPQNTEDKEGEN